MSQGGKHRPFRLPLIDIATRQPSTGAEYGAVILGGTALYGPDQDQLNEAVERIQNAIEGTLTNHLLMARNHLEKLVRQSLGENVNDRVLGAVLGRSLRLGAVCVLPCLTVNGRVMRMYFHKNNRLMVKTKLASLGSCLSGKTAMSVDNAQFECFPQREWGTRFVVKQLLAHLAYEGRAVFLDEDLFGSPLSSIEHALSTRRK